MPRIYAIVEGQTEESFVGGPLAEALCPRRVYLTPIILGVPGHKGGCTNYARVEKDVLRQLKQDRTAYCTTMMDFYGLGRGFPGTPLPPNLSPIQKVEHIERAVKSDICQRVPDLRPDLRFVPHLCLHEYEGLLFSGPEAFAQSIGGANLSASFREIRDGFATPEDINDCPDTAPSKRVLSLHRSYNKPLNGLAAARAVGIQAMRRECPHFRQWIEQLEALPELLS